MGAALTSKSFNSFFFGVLTFSLLSAGCGRVEELQSDEPGAVTQPDAAETVEQAATYSGLDSCGYCGNCVDYVRCRARNDSYSAEPPQSGWTYFSGKIADKNSNHAHRSCIAIIETSSVYGHVAYVVHVNTDADPNRITIHESNWTGCHSERTGTKDGLNIRGYWCPPGAHTSTCSGPL
jgi:surface antigen